MGDVLTVCTSERGELEGDTVLVSGEDLEVLGQAGGTRVPIDAVDSIICGRPVPGGGR
jgi:hypothetical protein